MEDCIFCKIADGRIKSELVYSDEDVVAFNDIDPKAPVHVLIVPRQHIERVEKVRDCRIFESVFKAAIAIAGSQGLDKDGFRIVVNSGRHGGQAVDHLHFHLLSGRQMQWPPG